MIVFHSLCQFNTLKSWIEEMRSHVDEGGKLSHKNGVELLGIVERYMNNPDENALHQVTENKEARQ